MQINDVMTRAPVTIEATTPVAAAMKMLYELDVRHLPVVSNGEVIGIVSDRDFRGLLADDLSCLIDPDGETEAMGAAVATLMSRDVFTLEPEASLAEAIDVMLEARVGAIPVVRPGTSELTGIVSYVDLLRALRDKASKA